MFTQQKPAKSSAFTPVRTPGASIERAPSTASNGSGGAAGGARQPVAPTAASRFAGCVANIYDFHPAPGFDAGGLRAGDKVTIPVPETVAASMGLRPRAATGPDPGEIDVLRKRIAEFERRVPLLESALGVAEAGQMTLLAENQTLVETARKEAAALQYSREQHVAGMEDNQRAALAFEARLAANDASIAGLMEENRLTLAENERLGLEIATLKLSPDAAAASVPAVPADAERVLVLEALLRTETETSASLEAELVKKGALLTESEKNYRAATASLRRDDARIAALEAQVIALEAQVIALEAQVTTGNQPIIFGTIGRDNVIRARVFQSNDLMGGDVMEVTEFRKVTGSSVASSVSYDPAKVQGSDASFDPDASSSIAPSPVLLPVVTDPLAVAPAVVLTAAPAAKGVLGEFLAQAVIEAVRKTPVAFTRKVLAHPDHVEIMGGIIQDLLAQDQAPYVRPNENKHVLVASLAEDILFILPSVSYSQTDADAFKTSGTLPADFTYVPPMKPADLVQHFKGTKMDAEQSPVMFHARMVKNYVAWGTDTSKKVAEIVKPVAEKKPTKGLSNLFGLI